MLYSSNTSTTCDTVLQASPSKRQKLEHQQVSLQVILFSIGIKG